MAVLEAIDVHPDVERELGERAGEGEGEVAAVPVVGDHEVEAADVGEVLQRHDHARADLRPAVGGVDEGGHGEEGEEDREQVPEHDVVGVEEEDEAQDVPLAGRVERVGEAGVVDSGSND